MSVLPFQNARGNAAGASALGPLDRLPPHNVEAEVGVLGGVMLDPEQIHEVATILRPSDFYRASHEAVFRAILALYDSQVPIDPIAVHEELVRTNTLSAVGDELAVADLCHAVPHVANVIYHAGVVKELATQRAMIEACNEQLRDVYSRNFKTTELLDSAEKRFFPLADSGRSSGPVEVREAINLAFDRIEARRGGGAGGLPTGFLEIDDLTDGFHPGQVVIVAGRPSMGKTAFALNICEKVVLRSKVPVLMFSMEMDMVELGERFLAARSGVDARSLKAPDRLNDEDRRNLDRAYVEFSTAPLFIDDVASRSIREIAAISRRAKLRQNIGMVVIDYIQLAGLDDAKGQPRHEQVAAISRNLKKLAKDLQVPVLALSQLNRLAEQREDKRPRMADMRESGGIEQDADLVMLLHRPDYYDPNDMPGVAECILAKNRNGATGTVKLAFNKPLMRFQPYVPKAEVAEPF